jgi:hypothetical protein
MSSLLGPNYRAGGDDPLGNAEVRRCVSSAIQARDDQALRGLVFATMQGRTQQLEQLITGCARQGPDTASADIAATDTSDAGIPKAALDTSYLAFSSAAARAEQRVRSDLANADRAALIADIEAIRDSVSEFDKSVRTIQVPDSARAEFARLLEADSATVGDLEAMSASTTGSELAAAANRLQNDAPGIDTAYVALLNAVSASPA